MHDVGAVVLSATLTIGLPDTHEITVEIATTDYRHPTPGWTTWHSDSPHLTGAVDGLAHLDITAALMTLGEAITRALHDTALAQD